MRPELLSQLKQIVRTIEVEELQSSGIIRVPGVTHEYATMYPGNVDHQAYLFFHGTNGAIGLHKADGMLQQMLPAQVNTGTQPRWLRKKPTCFYYLYLNELRRFDVADNSVVMIRKFNEYPNINGMGESDLSEDDDHLVLCSGGEIFVYEISTDSKISQLSTYSFDCLYLSADNEPIVGVYRKPYEDGPETPADRRGMQVFSNGRLRQITAELGHQDVGRDTNGDAIMVWCNSADASGESKNAALANCKNGVVKVRIADGKQTCLLSLDWSLAMHISMPSGNAREVYVSTYDPSNPNSEVRYANEILKVALDGSGVESLGKHGAAGSDYLGTPRASVSPDGTLIVYDSQGDVIIRRI